MSLLVLLSAPRHPSVLRGERGITAAIILACTTGHWIEELNECLGFELDEPDANGYTPLMHALTFGKTNIVRNLIRMGVDCTEQVRCEQEASLSTISYLERVLLVC